LRIGFLGESENQRETDSEESFAALKIARSPPRNCPHKALPFVKAPAKSNLTSSIKTQLGDHLAALSAFRIIDVPIMAARDKDMQCKRVMLGFHRRKFAFNVAYRRG
jgi:hypothetical protein